MNVFRRGTQFALRLVGLTFLSSGRFFLKKEFAMKRVGTLLSASVVCWLVAGARGDDPVKLPLDNAFLIKIATCNHAVLVMSKMAEAQGSPDVKAFAAHLSKSHQATDDKLADLFKSRKVGVVSGTEPETKAEIQHLSDLKGTAFDREYLSWIIKEHRSGVPVLENQIKLGQDADVRTFAKGTLETARKHTQEAEALAKTLSSK
jgi:putative membrane protein